MPCARHCLGARTTGLFAAVLAALVEVAAARNDRWLARYASDLAATSELHLGNLVVFDQNARHAWTSQTHTNAGASLYVQNDGNVVPYRPDGAAVWATNTVVGP